MSTIVATGFDKDAFHSAISNDQSDLACAILGTNLLDRRISYLIAKSIPLSGLPKTLFKRINLLNDNNLIENAVISDLHDIRIIRNKYAHEIDYQLSFESNFQQECESLKTSQALIEGHQSALGRPGNNLADKQIKNFITMLSPARCRFEQTVWFISLYLEELAGIPNSFADVGLISQVRALGEQAGKLGISGTASVSK